MRSSVVRNPQFWLGVLLCVGGLAVIGSYLITPTYIGALLHLHH